MKTAQAKTTMRLLYPVTLPLIAPPLLPLSFALLRTGLRWWHRRRREETLARQTAVLEDLLQTDCLTDEQRRTLAALRDQLISQGAADAAEDTEE